MAVALTDRPPPARRSRDNDYALAKETLGLWNLVKGIGRGGMGEVYEATYDYLHLLTLRYAPEDRGRLRLEIGALPREEQARLASEMLGTPLPPDAHFAIKVCGARSGTAGFRRFIQEAELAQRLGDHPYIVTIHAIHAGGEGSSTLPIDAGKHRDVAFMVMDLATRSFDHTKLTLTESVHVVRCIATALDHAHHNGVVHRDLKPENILGTVRHPLLTDFGIAKELDHSLGLTRTGQVIGTLDYMSPEQATDAKTVDHRSDIYSLGVVLYEFATQGGLPYIHLAEREACLAAIRSATDEGKWPRDHQTSFPGSLERVILKATAHDPADRYQEMSEFILDLDRISRGEWVSPVGRVGAGRWLRYQMRRRPRVVWGVPTILVTVLVIWLVTMLPRWLDGTRQDLDARLGDLDLAVNAIVDRSGPMQLDLNQREQLTRLTNDLKGQEERYPDQVARLGSLTSTLAANRFLRATFSGPNAPTGEESLRQAAGITDGAGWTLSQSGLLVHDHTLLTLRPYGEGLVYVLVTLSGHEGFKLTVRELGEVRHRTVARVIGGRLTITRQQDEEPPTGLWAARVSPNGDATIALLVGEREIKAWLPREQEAHKAGSLMPGAAAEVSLDLPRGTVLKHLEIWPQAPR
jgi:serine/threonine protein kinase